MRMQAYAHDLERLFIEGQGQCAWPRAYYALKKWPLRMPKSILACAEAMNGPNLTRHNQFVCFWKALAMLDMIPSSE